MAKLPKSTYPAGHSAEDFRCFGPPALEDGNFDNCMIADLGSFNQDGKDSNKYYHGAVVQSKKNNLYAPYYEWGRVGQEPDFQFGEFGTEAQAKAEFVKQMHAKNDKRGEWVNHPTLGRILQAKAGKDCYLVRKLQTRATGLPDAKTIGVVENNIPTKTKTSTSKKSSFDTQTISLLRDLNIATISYTRNAMVDASLPTQAAIDECRNILFAAMNRLKVVGSKIEDQVKDSELNQLTRLMYGRIPKKKPRNAAADTWVLSASNIGNWQQDLDAFESALSNTVVDSQEQISDSFRAKLSWLSPTSKEGQFLYYWLPRATRNKHGNVGDMKIKNIWLLDREGDETLLKEAQKRIGKTNPKHTPILQPDTRVDLSSTESQVYRDTHTCLLIHGTRSVNVKGIMEKDLLMPAKLKGVTINGAMFGPGNYWADDWKKSAGYTSLKNSYYSSGDGEVAGRGAFLFLADVVLGSPYLADVSYGYDDAPKGHHAIFGKAEHSKFNSWSSSTLKNNEWITFSKDQKRLKYVIEFTVK